MEKVQLNKSVFDNRGQFEKREKEIEVPELNALMGTKEGQVVTVVVSQLGLGDYLEAMGEAVDIQRNLIEGIVEAASSKELVKAEALKALNKMSPELRRQIIIAQKGVVKPEKMKTTDLIFIANNFPFAITKIVNEIIALTSVGSLKKNSSD